MTENRFYDCPHCGAGGLIPTLDGTCTNCGRSLEESPANREVPVNIEPVKKRSKRIVVLCLLMVAGSIMAFWYSYDVLQHGGSRWTKNGRIISLTPKQTIAILEKMMTPGDDGKSYDVELQYAEAKSVYRRKKTISAGLILIGIVSLVGAGVVVLREYRPRSGFPRPGDLSPIGKTESGIWHEDDGEDEADNCSDWLADAKETDTKCNKLHCKACGKPLPRAQVDYMLGNPKYNEWCREGFCRSSCFEKHRENRIYKGDCPVTDQEESVSPDQSSCRNCGVKVMPSTLKKNNGMCAPCASSPEKANIRRANRAPEELRSASEDGDVGIVKRSIDSNVDVDARDQYGATALHKASRKGQAEVVKLLIEANANVNTCDNHSSTALHEAAGAGQAEVVTLLMEANADIDARKDDGETALLVASQKNKTEVVKLLIDAGADVNACSHYGSFALYGAGEEGRIELVRLLIDANANVDARNSYSSTVLHGASQFGRTEIVNILLKAKANIEAQDQWGFTPLMCASKAGHCDIVKILLERSADVGAFSEKRHFTALHCAAANGHMEIIKLLINAKADAMARDLGGQTAIDYAKENNHSEVVTFLERAGTEITHRALTQDELIMNFDSKIYFFARKIKKRNEVLTEQALGTANHEECVDAMQAVDKERETILNILLQLDEGSWRNYVNKDFSKACECGVVEMCNFFKRAIDCPDQNIQKIGLILIRSSSSLFDLIVDNESSPAYELKLRKLVR